jgi:hypothetical protein
LTAAPSWLAVDEMRIAVDSEEKRVYVTIDTGSKLLLEIDVFGHFGTDFVAAFPPR